MWRQGGSPAYLMRVQSYAVHPVLRFESSSSARQSSQSRSSRVQCCAENVHNTANCRLSEGPEAVLMIHGCFVKLRNTDCVKTRIEQCY